MILRYLFFQNSRLYPYFIHKIFQHRNLPSDNATSKEEVLCEIMDLGIFSLLIRNFSRIRDTKITPRLGNIGAATENCDETPSHSNPIKEGSYLQALVFSFARLCQSKHYYLLKYYCWYNIQVQWVKKTFHLTNGPVGSNRYGKLLLIVLILVVQLVVSKVIKEW